MAHYYTKELSIVLSNTSSIQTTMDHIPNFVVDFKNHTTKIDYVTRSVLNSRGMPFGGGVQLQGPFVLLF